MKKILLATLLVVSSVFATESAVAGQITGDDDNTTEVCLGFTPEYVEVTQVNAGTSFVLYEDMNDTSHILVTHSTGAITYPESVTITIGSITQDSGVKCYGFSTTNTNTPIQYKAIR